MDTVTLVRSAIRGVLAAAGRAGDRSCASVLRRDDDYRSGGKPAVRLGGRGGRGGAGRRPRPRRRGGARGTRGRAARTAPRRGRHAARDACWARTSRTPDGRIRIARRVAPDRVISTVDPEARHGHKTAASGFDGYKGHVALDPDAELITATAVTPGNAGDGVGGRRCSRPTWPRGDPGRSAAAVYGDSAYGTGPLLATLEAARVVSRVKVQPPNAPGGRFTKDDFTIDLVSRTVTCPAGRVAAFRGSARTYAEFGRACATCPLAARCTISPDGRKIEIGPHEARLAHGRAASRDPAWLCRLQGDAAEGRAQARPPHAPSPRWPAGEGPGPAQGRPPTSPRSPRRALARLAVLGLTGVCGTWATRTG